MMPKRARAFSLILATLGFLGCSASNGDRVEPNLNDLLEGRGWRVVNRSVTAVLGPEGPGVRLDAGSEAGIAWLEEPVFGVGTLEVDLRGKDVPQQSFVGIAFNAVDDSTYEAVYVRPFNFRSEDPVRRSHGVQYIAHPEHTWYRLREAHPGKFEQPVDPPPDPEAWMRLRVVVAPGNVSVFVGEGEEPDLVAERLTDRRQGRVGLWVGNGSDGEFANLKVVPAK